MTSISRLLMAAILAWPILGAAASDASALSFDVVELSGCETPAPSSGCFGETITIGIRFENSTGLDLRAIGASITGFDLSVAQFVSGQATSSVLNSVCVPTLGCFGGLDNSSLSSTGLSLSLGNPLGPEVQFLNAVTVTGSNEDGSLDPGLDGIPGGGGAQFRVQFQIGAPGITTLDIGFNVDFNDFAIPSLGETLFPPSANVQVVLSSEGSPFVIPEPNLGMLFGVGLMLLAGAPRRR